MPPDANATPIGYLWAVVSGIGTIMLAGFGLMFNYISGVVRDVNADRQAMQERIDKLADGAGDAQLDAARRFATKEDVEKVRTDVLDRIDQSDQLLQERMRRILVEELNKHGQQKRD